MPDPDAAFALWKNSGRCSQLSAKEFFDLLTGSRLELRSHSARFTTKLRASNSIDWYVRESVRAKPRLMVKTILKK
jgi:hypothetical protein